MPGCQVLARVRLVALQHPDRTALATADGRLSYRELLDEIEQWAVRLGQWELPSASPVALISDGGPDLPAAFLGARANGLVPTLLDPHSGRDNQAAAEMVRAGAVIDVGTGRISRLDRPPIQLDPGAAYIVFSSGSQGSPKAIVGSAQGLVHFLDWEVDALALRPGVRTSLLTSPSFDVVFRDLLLPLFVGGELHIAGHRVRTSPAQVLPWLRDHDIEVAHVVPSLALRWIEAGPAVTLAGLRWTLFAGERLFDRQVRRWTSIAPCSRIVNLYGPAETTLAAFAHEVALPPPAGIQPVGRPLPGITVQLQPIGDGPTGTSITIESPYGSLGYLPGACGPDDLARLSRTDNLTRFRTQDRGRIDATGDLIVEGRLDTLVKRHGSFVDTALIEAAAIELDGVQAACCVQVDAAGSGRVILVVQCRDDAVLSGLRRSLRRAGAALPDQVVADPSMPLLPSGKVDRRRVRDLLEPDGCP